MRAMTKRRVVLSLLTVSLILIGALIVLDRQNDESTPSGMRPSQRARVGWERLVDSGLKELRANPPRPPWPYSAIRGPSRRMPERMRKGVLEALGKAEPLKLRFDQARYLATPVGVGIWVVPGEGVTCIVDDEEPATSCDTTAQVARRGLRLEVYKADPRHHGRPTHFLALGIAPDWVDAVKARVGKGFSSIPVIDNAYGRRAEVPIVIQPLHR